MGGTRTGHKGEEKAGSRNSCAGGRRQTGFRSWEKMGVVIELNVLKRYLRLLENLESVTRTEISIED